MKILHINTFDDGGAAKACLRLHEGLLDQGIDSKVLIKSKKFSFRETYLFRFPNPNLWDRVKNKLLVLGKRFKLIPEFSKTESIKILLKKQRKGLEIFSYPEAETDITLSPLYKAADIIHLHWVAGFLDWPSFFAKNRKPIVWTLHDQNPFLGIDHYAERFFGIDDDGRPIQRLYSQEEISEEKKVNNYKKRIVANVKNLVVVCPSKWLMSESKKSQVLGRFVHYHIPNGFPTNIFKPYNQDFCRDVLNLPKNKKIILFVSQSVDSIRKGFKLLRKALELLKDSNVLMCSVGYKADSESRRDSIDLGYVHDERLMAVIYSAADLFIVPSLEDNLPNTMIEALLCGTPVVGFPVGGIPDVIVNEKNGFLSATIDAVGLKEAIQNVLNNIDKYDRNLIAEDAFKKFNLALQAKRYIEVYQKVLQEV